MTSVPVAASAATSARTAASTAVADARVITATVGRLARMVADAGAWPAEERRGLLGHLDRAVDALAAVRATVLLAERESGAWQGGGDRSFQAWRARTSLAGERTAAAQVRQAEHLAAVPSVAAAVTEGRVGLEQATTIGRVAATGTPAQQAAVASPDGQAELLQIAATQDAGTFATTVAGLVASIDPDGLERDHQAQRRARFLQLSDTPRGTFIKGRLDSMAGHRLRLALEALTSRPGADDDRDPGQRRADALDTMVGRVLSDSDTKPGAHVSPHISMILSEATWQAARAERDRRRSGTGVVAQRGSGAQASTVRGSASGASYEPATLEDGTPVPPGELARVMCDCDVTRIVVDAEGALLDLGRTQRLFTGPQRRAVIARDRECAWPSCHAPARWCEIHHLPTTCSGGTGTGARRRSTPRPCCAPSTTTRCTAATWPSPASPTHPPRGDQRDAHRPCPRCATRSAIAPADSSARRRRAGEVAGSRPTSRPSSGRPTR